MIVRWKKSSDVSIEKCVTIGFINDRKIKATVWTYTVPFSALVEGEGIHDFQCQFKSLIAAKRWASQRFNEICKRF